MGVVTIKQRALTYKHNRALGSWIALKRALIHQSHAHEMCGAAETNKTKTQPSYSIFGYFYGNL